MDALVAGADAFETFFDQVGVGLALADLTATYVRSNTAYAALVGRSPEDLVGVPLDTVLLFEDPRHRAELAAVVEGEQSRAEGEGRYLRPDGHETWVMHGVTVVRDRSGAAVWLAVSAQDITERRQAEDSLKELSAIMTERAVRDPLTGLANRALLEERLRAALARDARTGGQTGLLFLDLDGFKAVNDQHGHAVGDEVLCAVAGRLRHVVRPSDTVARLGGDEFVVLLEGVTDDLSPLVTRLQAAVEEPVAVGEDLLAVGVSIGQAMSIGGVAEPSALLAQADRSMYSVKQQRS
jgi:diguanylate cyclase (GGDEF)-like protein/PAS domain S-box-containing protein